MTWKWNGSKWWKCDFHAHSPASDDYGRGPSQASLKIRTPKEWLLDYMHAGIDCVAVTDHNAGAWVDQIKNALNELNSERPAGYRPIHIFPGVEISVNGGVHLLAILDIEKTTSDIDSLLGAVGFSGTKGSCDAVTNKSFSNVVEAIVQAGGIAIPAHVDDKNGLFQLTGTTLQQALNSEAIFAMELMEPTYKKPSQYQDLKLTEILGSDAHHPSGTPGQRYPGSHFTWVKMGTPSIEGLRLALLDGALSVRRSDQETSNPNEHAPLALESIEISQARYLGRYKVFNLGLNPWLNAIIGGRGTGKSTIIEFLRIALQREDELPEELKPDFEKYGKVYESRDDAGLLTNTASIRVIYRKEDSRFRIQWKPEGDLESIEQEDNEGWHPAEGDIQQRFPIRIYSQKQIFQLAKAPLALLRVVDEAPEVDRRSWSERWKTEEARFLSLRADARELEIGLAEEARFKGELDDVRRKLAVFERAGHADVLKTFQRKSRQKRMIESWEESWIGTGEQLRKIASEIVPDSLDESNFNPGLKEDAEFLKLSFEIHNSFKGIGKNIESLASQADQIAVEWRKERDQSSWQESVNAAEKAYEELQEKLASGGVDDPAAYGELVQRQQAIEQHLKDLGKRKKQVAELRKQANESLQRLLKIRKELTEFRRKFLQKVLSENQFVKIQIIPYGAKETVEEEFRRLIHRTDGGFEKDIGTPDGEGLLAKLYENANSDGLIEKNLSEIKDTIRKIKEQTDAILVKDQRFATHIKRLPPEAIDRLDLWFPEDSLEVQYSTTGDGRDFRSIQEGSPGQKTAALLAFLLSYGKEPLVLDQPEDDLDNHLIYDLIVTQLREVKRHRQIIVVTHNANIVVNGDAELVVALAVRGGETHKDCVGSLQEKPVRDTICSIMEGGRKAFEDRYRRIALEGRYLTHRKSC